MIRRGAMCGLIAAAAVLSPPVAPSNSGKASAESLGPRIRVSATWPKDRTFEVLTDSIVVKFSRPVDLATVDSGTFQVSVGAGLMLPGVYAHGVGKKGIEPRVVVFSPAAPLPRQAQVRVFLGLGIRSLLGRALDEPVEFSFATDFDKNEAGFTPLGPKDKPRRLPSRGPVPKVKWTFPQAGFGNVFSDDVRVRFNRAMDGGTIQPGSFKVLDGNVAVPGTITFPADGERREVLFTPAQSLFPDNNYQILVTRSARTERGRYLKAEFRAGFGTSPLKQGIRPLHPEEFIPGPLLMHGRVFHTACAIAGGDVVIAGGQAYDGTPLASTEIFRRNSTSVVGVDDMETARRKHAAVTLLDGRVLVCGGFGPTGATLASTEIFDPSSNAWVDVGPMAVGRANHTATLLPNGKVLVVAGYTNDGGPFTWTRTAEVFNPASNTWSAAGTPVAERGGHTATMLPDGRVLIVGGARGGALVAELYLPISNSFRRTLGDPLEDRIFHAASLTRAGTVLLAGGFPGPAEQFVPATEVFSHSGSCAPADLGLSESALFPTLTLLPGTGGRVAYIGGLVEGAGGGGTDLVLDETQVWSPKAGGGTGGFTAMLFDIEVPRAGHTVTTLADGRYVIVGGFGTIGDENERRCTIFAPEL